MSFAHTAPFECSQSRTVMFPRRSTCRSRESRYQLRKGRTFLVPIAGIAVSTVTSNRRTPWFSPDHTLRSWRMLCPARRAKNLFGMFGRELNSLKNYFLGRPAVVVGAGLGGLSAARVLADYFDEVIILDRDELPDDAVPRDAVPRPGVPQGKHPHVLLGGGLKALENLAPLS